MCAARHMPVCTHVIPCEFLVDPSFRPSGECALRSPIRINFSKGKSGGASGGDKWGSANGAKTAGRTERPYKPAGEKPEGCLEIFVGNLPWSITEEKITEFFGTAGATVRSAPALSSRRICLGLQGVHCAFGGECAGDQHEVAQ